MDDIKIIKDRALNMYKADKDNGNLAMFQAMWDMWNMDWTMPKKLSKHTYIRKMVSPDPHDAIRVGTQVLASVMPMPSINSLAPDPDSRAHFDDLERAISWLFRMACMRRGNPLADIVRHALLFDRVAAQVVYLPNQIGILKAFQGEKHRKAHALRYGPFAIIVRDPRNVHVEWSDYMPERVLYRSLMPIHEMVDFWGERAKRIVNKKKFDKWDGYEWATVFDYHDMEQRVVWAVMQDNNSRMASPTDGETNKDAHIILQEENKLDFLPWVVRDGGDQLDPILLPVWKTNLWEDMNLYETLMSSEIIAHTAAPRIKKTSYNPDGIPVDYGEPGGSVNVQPGEDVEQLLPPQMDANLAQLLDRLQGRMAKSTVPNVIQSVDFPAEWAYATLNLAVQSGVKVLTPARELAQRALSDIYKQMFYWVDYSGETVVAYPTRQEIVPEAVGEGMSEFARVIPNQTEQIEIRPGEFDSDHMYIDVALEMDIPSDKVGRAQTAVTLKERLQYSNRQALEDVGVSDPDAMMEEWKKERQEQNDFEIGLEVDKERALTDVLVEREQKLMEARQAAPPPEAPPPPPNTIENPALGGQQEAGRNPANQAQARANAGTQLPLGGM